MILKGLLTTDKDLKLTRKQWGTTNEVLMVCGDLRYISNLALQMYWTLDSQSNIKYIRLIGMLSAIATYWQLMTIDRSM